MVVQDIAGIVKSAVVHQLLINAVMSGDMNQNPNVFLSPLRKGYATEGAVRVNAVKEDPV